MSGNLDQDQAAAAVVAKSADPEGLARSVLAKSGYYKVTAIDCAPGVGPVCMIIAGIRAGHATTVIAGTLNLSGHVAAGYLGYRLVRSWLL